MIAEVGRRGPKGDPGESGVVTYAAIGSVLYHAGTTPPAGYLVCDGTVYNIADYPELAQFFADNYGSANYWGGDGTTTFAVPDWRGEFFRASGQNSRANQGSGAAVGAHQDATAHVYTFYDAGGKLAWIQGYEESRYPKNRDFTESSTVAQKPIIINYNTNNDSAIRQNLYTSRPTNTSLLVCIKAKMVDNMAELVAAVVRQMSSQLDPVGKVIYYAGLTAPANYLACDGTVHNIADYPELAQFFAVNYGSANYWGGDGTTTFAVPDWRGEFFRASGTNSRTSQGSGAEVGTHQDASKIATARNDPSGNLVLGKTSKDSDSLTLQGPFDKVNTGDAFLYAVSMGTGASTFSNVLLNATTRPTNTSLLVCIKAA